MLRLSYLVQQLVPPALLSYFFWAWKTTTFDIGPRYALENTGYFKVIYRFLPTLLITPITISFLTLYFLPRNQSVPPANPPKDILEKRVIFECLSPTEAEIIRLAIARLTNEENETDAMDHRDDQEPVVNRCWKGRCGGRWKPARARHCSECGVCRAGFDHHCAFFANCLTAPWIPTFLRLCLYTPPTTILLSLPLYLPLFHRSREAWRYACVDESIRQNWWDWWASWVMAGGPVGRWGGGLVLGWRALDRVDQNDDLRLGVGVLVFIGIILGLITGALAITSITLVLKGDLTIDRERHRSYSRALRASHRMQGPIPDTLKRDLERYGERRYFWIPTSIGGEPDGAVIETVDERAYDSGFERNWEMVMGKGYGWLLPWGSTRMSYDDIINWPLSPSVQKRMEAEAIRRIQRRDDA